MPLLADDATVVSVPVKALPFLGNPGSSPTQLVRLGSQVLFTADDGMHGRELWASDGTLAGSRMVKDIRPGPATSNPLTLVVMGDAVFFQATTTESGAELWRSNGTAEGTQLVKDIETGSASSSVNSLAAAGGRLFFSATTSAEGANLWKTDGSAAATQMVLDFTPGTASGYPYATKIAPLGDGVIFAAPVAASAFELWGSDGTAAGTRRLLGTTGTSYSPQAPFPAVSYPSIPGVAFFNFTVGFSEALWRTDGTPEGTWKLGNVPEATQPYIMGSKMLFKANDGVHGEEPWVTDGTVEGTKLLKDLDQGSPWSHPQGFFPIGNQVGFHADTITDLVWELWKTDGTADGTQMVYSVDRSIRGGGGVSLGAKSVFFAAAGSSGHGLWVTDGTAGGTSLLKALGLDSPNAPPIVSLGTKAIFASGDGLRGSELWVTDGTVAGTQLLRDIQSQNQSNSPIEATYYKNRLYFTSSSAAGSDIELWRSDGTATGTTRFYDLAAGAQSSDPTNFVTAGNLLYFYAKSTASGNPYGLWRTDGSVSGTLRLHANASNVSSSATPGPAVAMYQGFSYFRAAGSEGEEIWRTDGTVAGTALFKDLAPGTVTARPDNFMVAGTRLFFTVLPLFGPPGLEKGLFATDGTATGTHPMLLPGGMPFDTRPRYLRSDGSRIYFTHFGVGIPDAIFCTDGGEFATTKLSDGYSWDSTIVQTSADGPVLFYVLAHATGPAELWRSAGTVETTRLVKVLPGSGSASARGLMDTGGQLFFNVFTDVNGEELWTSDGTQSGTRLVKDMAPGPESSSPSGLTAYAGYVLFSAWDATHGRELWISDGTTEGTVLVEDSVPGAGSGIPASLTPAGTALSFFLSGPDMPQHELRSLPVYTITTLGTPAAGGRISGGGTHPAGAAVAVTAHPVAGFVFDGWTGLPAGSPPDAATRVRLTGNLTLTVRFAAVPGYDAWIAEFPLPPEDRLPNLNPSGDGVPNLLKYAFNLNPQQHDVRSFDPGAAAGLPTLRQTAAGLRFEYAERRGAALTYEPQAATDTNDWHSLTGSVERTQLNTFWDMVSIAPAAIDGHGFFRVRITLGQDGQ